MLINVHSVKKKESEQYRYSLDFKIVYQNITWDEYI